MIDLEVKGIILQPVLLILLTWVGKCVIFLEITTYLKGNFDISSVVSKVDCTVTTIYIIHVQYYRISAQTPNSIVQWSELTVIFWGLEKKCFKTLLPQSRSAVVVPLKLFFKHISLTKLQCTSYSILWKFFFML